MVITQELDDRLDARFLAEWEAFYRRYPDDIAATLGLQPVRATDISVELRMPLRKGINQPAGMFSAAALIGLADVTCSFLCMRHLPTRVFPFAVQLNTNLLSNTDKGSATATATFVKKGRMLMVAEARVHGDDGRLLALVNATLMGR